MFSKGRTASERIGFAAGAARPLSKHPRYAPAAAAPRATGPARARTPPAPRPQPGRAADYVKLVLDEMDGHGIERAMIGVGQNPDAQRALRQHPDRFFGSFEVNPNLGMEGVRQVNNEIVVGLVYQEWNV